MESYQEYRLRQPAEKDFDFECVAVRPIEALVIGIPQSDEEVNRLEDDLRKKSRLVS